MQGFNLSYINDIWIGIEGLKTPQVVDLDHVTAIYLGSTLVWPRNAVNDYLTLYAIEDTQFAIVANTDLSNATISYSFDDGSTWVNLIPGSGITPVVPAGRKIILKGNLSTIGASQSYGCPIRITNDWIYVGTYGKFNVSGNPASLYFGDNFANTHTLYPYMYDGLFSYNDSLVGAKDLSLPELDLSNAEWCYAHMFSSCSELKYAPNLPATTLSNNCYNGMFSGCSSLTTTPALSATSLAYGCYQDMFSGCTSLVATTELPATTLATYCYCGMFTGCTSLTTAPELHASTLATYCYAYMFDGCSSLNEITCLATDISATNCTYSWVANVAPVGTFIKDANMSNWTIDSVDGIPVGWTVQNYTHNYSHEYLTFEALESGSFTWTGTVSGNSISYSIDNGSTWNILASGSSTSTVSTGSKVLFKASSLYISTGDGIGRFSSSGNFNVMGNVMSLIYGDNFVNQTTLNDYNLLSLFNGCTKLIDASNLILPATTLSNCCYEYMFNGCTSLTTAPALPATTLANYCYAAMFIGCTSLTTAPALPATTLSYACYWDMFAGCTSLTAAPTLPATTLTQQCYEGMFNGCSSLSSITCLATNISATDCVTSWVYGVAVSGTFTRDSNMNNWTIGYDGIPNGWSVVPPLAHDYSQDYLTFEALESGTFTWTDTANSNSISYSTDNGSTWNILTSGSSTPTIAANNKVLFKASGLTVDSSNGIGTFSSTCRFDAMGNIMSLQNGDNFINSTTINNSHQFNKLFNNCTKLVDASNLVLPATTLTEGCYEAMFYECTSLTTAPALPATILYLKCYFDMFCGCTSLTIAPTLPASTLAGQCYYRMFADCSSLNSITCLATDISAGYCTSAWVRNVAASGTFTKDASMTSWTTGRGGIPNGWTVQDAS